MYVYKKHNMVGLKRSTLVLHNIKFYTGFARPKHDQTRMRHWLSTIVNYKKKKLMHFRCPKSSSAIPITGVDCNVSPISLTRGCCLALNNVDRLFNDVSPSGMGIRANDPLYALLQPSPLVLFVLSFFFALYCQNIKKKLFYLKKTCQSFGLDLTPL